jgi:lipopolysaccharide transport system ATP-binding protein
MEVLRVENISKRYKLGEVNRKSFIDDLKLNAKRALGKETSLDEQSEVNDRTTLGLAKYVWALRDINMSVNQGEVIGIVGRNGAGKSTLLKLLSRVTGPTEGSIKVKGRMASLLEVGTGFHPELTGRENVFLNGAILGMSKDEIASNFEAIIEFSGVARYIDTPVKRYSSGMYVRLAFAIAVHLDPEILIIDEVLAVGDSTFQKRCIDKMKEISESGRTVLFVSHNMDSVRRLCGRSILLDKGEIVMTGDTESVIQEYLNGGHADTSFGIIPEGYPRNSFEKNILEIKSIVLKNQKAQLTDQFFYKEKIEIELLLEVQEPLEGAVLITSFGNNSQNRITYHSSNNDKIDGEGLNLEPGTYMLKTIVDQQLLPGAFHVNVSIMNDQGYPYDAILGFGTLVVNTLGIDKEIKYPWGKSLGSVFQENSVTVEKVL